MGFRGPVEGQLLMFTSKLSLKCNTEGDQSFNSALNDLPRPFSEALLGGLARGSELRPNQGEIDEAPVQSGAISRI